jgi:hypothetical protein
MANAAETKVRPCTQQQWREAVEKHADLDIDASWRRTNERFSVGIGNATIVLSKPAQLGAGNVVRDAILLNISADGLMLKAQTNLPEDIGVGINLAMGDDTFTLVGRIAHCTQTLGGFKVGVELKFSDG